MKRKIPRALSRWEEILWMWLGAEMPGEWIREYQFHPKRKWRFDFALPSMRLAVEVDGMLYGDKKGGHQTPAGFERDREKDAEGMIMGWQILRVTPKMLRDGSAYVYIRELTHTGGRTS